MEEEIIKALETKREWREHRSGIDRRKKNGTPENRKNAADCIKAGRNSEACARSYKICTDIKWLLIGALTGIIMFIGIIVSHAENINMNIIANIESSGDPAAFNAKENAVGMYQIRRRVLEDYNANHDDGYHCKYTMEEMFNQEYAFNVGDWYINEQIPEYIKKYGIPDTITTRIIAYNWGIGNLRKWFESGSRGYRLPRLTKRYIKKYYIEMGKI